MTREEAIQILGKYLQEAGSENYASAPSDFTLAVREAIWALKDPEIIRCKDCRYAGPDFGVFYCKKNHFKTDINDWCSRARRWVE